VNCLREIEGKFQEHMLGNSTDLRSARELALFVTKALSEEPIVPPEWEGVLKRAKALTRRISTRSVEYFIVTLEQCFTEISESISIAPAYEEPKKEGREGLFKEGLVNPSRFVRDLYIKVETHVDIDIIINDNPSYKDREYEFRKRIKNPASFRRGN